MHMRIVQGNHLIADLPDWPHPVPRVGDYIFHPPYGSSPEGIAGCVRTVTWRTHDRPDEQLGLAGGTGFVMTASPYVELAI